MVPGQQTQWTGYLGSIFKAALWSAPSTQCWLRGTAARRARPISQPIEEQWKNAPFLFEICRSSYCMQFHRHVGDCNNALEFFAVASGFQRQDSYAGIVNAASNRHEALRFVRPSRAT